MHLKTKVSRGGISWSLKALSLLLFAMSGVTSGCKGTQTIWTAESGSPDGKMVATARAFANGGFGVSGGPSTFVYLNWITGSQSPTEILGTDDQSDRTDDVKVGMNWLAPNRLELTYIGRRQNISFQAIKFDGVVISLRDISSATSSGNTP
jgi:hypothetical protein